jgi:large subunit ribosomal protein L31
MQKGIHPKNYRPVVFKDMSCDYALLTQSAVETSDTIEWEDGNTYPLVKLEISNMSHPFFTGKQMLLDSTGRVERFNKRYARKTK